jgi:hypothetical protein
VAGHTPAGSVDAGAADDDGVVGLRRQLSALQEEPGLSPDMVGEPHPLCIVEHPGSHVSDPHLTADAVLAHRDGGNAEYDRIPVVPEAQLATFLAEAGRPWCAGA